MSPSAHLRGAYGAALLFLAILLVVPIWAVEYPPLVDYPNHLARGYILYHHDDVPTFREHFDADYLSTPSLAMDGFMLALQPILPLRIAGKLFLTLTILLWLVGWHLLGRAIHGHATWLSLGAALFAYHSMFFYGFTNFAFGLGVFLVALAAWYHGRAHWGWWRHLLVAVLAVACFFSHLAAFIFLAGSVFAITAWEASRERRLRLLAIIDAAPVLVPLLCVRGGGQSGLEWNFPGKLVGALTLVRGYNRYLDLAYLAAIAIFVALLFLFSTRTRVVGSVLFVGVGCLAMFLVGPTVLFGGAPADARFLLPAAALITLAFDFEFPRPKAITLLAVFVGLVVFRLGTIGYYWHGIDAELRGQVALFAAIPEGAKVYPMVKIADGPDEKKQELPMFHAVGYAVIDRRVYVPTLIAFAGHNPLRYKEPRVTGHADPEPFPPAEKVDWELIFARHDYLYCWHVPDTYRREIEKRCVPVVEKDGGSIWRVAESLK